MINRVATACLCLAAVSTGATASVWIWDAAAPAEVIGRYTLSSLIAGTAVSAVAWIAWMVLRSDLRQRTDRRTAITEVAEPIVQAAVAESLQPLLREIGHMRQAERERDQTMARLASRIHAAGWSEGYVQGVAQHCTCQRQPRINGRRMLDDTDSFPRLT